MSKLGINETKDIIRLVDHLVDKVKESFDKDGKVDKEDLIKAILGEPGVVFKAVWGSWDVEAELKDLEESEVKEMVEMLLPIVKKIADLYV